MTHAELTTRARDRAIVENIRVHPIAGNSHLFAATSTTTEPGGFWLLSVDVAGAPSCSCPAGQCGKPCKHAEAVRMRLYETRMLATVQADSIHGKSLAELAELFTA